MNIEKKRVKTAIGSNAKPRRPPKDATTMAPASNMPRISVAEFRERILTGKYGKLTEAELVVKAGEAEDELFGAFRLQVKNVGILVGAVGELDPSCLEGDSKVSFEPLKKEFFKMAAAHLASSRQYCYQSDAKNLVRAYVDYAFLRELARAIVERVSPNILTSFDTKFGKGSHNKLSAAVSKFARA